MEKILIFAFGMVIMCLLWRIINIIFDTNKFISNIFGKTKKGLPNYENNPNPPLIIIQYSESDKSENEKIAETYLNLCHKKRSLEIDIKRLKSEEIKYYNHRIKFYQNEFFFEDFHRPEIERFVAEIINKNKQEIIKINEKLLELEKQVPFQPTKGGNYEIDSI